VLPAGISVMQNTDPFVGGRGSAVVVSAGRGWVFDAGVEDVLKKVEKVERVGPNGAKRFIRVSLATIDFPSSLFAAMMIRGGEGGVAISSILTS
jgi:hypothetical protein